MAEYYESVQKGFRILLSAMSEFIGSEMRKAYKDNWWDEVLSALSDQRDLPYSGSYGELVDSIDIANCIRLIERRWKEVFADVLSMNCRTYAKELMGVRNIVSHIGQNDLDQPTAERALDTMARLCSEIDSDTSDEIRVIYREVRAKADDTPAQTKSKQSDEKNLIGLIGTDAVQETRLTRKVTYGGKTVVYPVYRVRLDKLYYNDQNDRISTWITQYEAENGQNPFGDIDREIYNRVIENFIFESNPDSIYKTQKNIGMVGQREPGVTLSDGRVVDGNRRFTCLRRIQREKPETVYFETVILDAEISESKKQIKLLELSIQHGEEKKVDYDQIDFAVGTYIDIVKTKLLTVEEYAMGTNETAGDVRKRIEVAELVCEFLEYLRLPEQYHIAREYQVYSLFQEMMPLVRQLKGTEKETLKIIAFNNAMMKACPDQRKFIRDIKSLIKNNCYADYFAEQTAISAKIGDRYRDIDVKCKDDIDSFADENSVIAAELHVSMEKALQRARNAQLISKPSENVEKCISFMMDIDPRLFAQLNAEEKDILRSQLDQLEKLAEKFKELL